MSRRQRTPHGHSAEVEDSIQYLQRYFDDADCNERRPQLFSPNRESGVVAAGVLPASAARGERWTGYTRGAVSPGKIHDQPPRSARKPERGIGSSRMSSSYNRLSPMRGDGFLRNERSSPICEEGTRATNLSFYEPLSLRYGYTTNTPVGRPPLHHQQNVIRGGTLAQKGASNDRWGDFPPRRDDVNVRYGQHHGKSARQRHSESAVTHGRWMYDDAERTLDIENAEKSRYIYSPRRRHSYQKEGLLDESKNYDDNEESEEEEEEKQRRRKKVPPSNRVNTTGEGNGGERHRTMGDDHAPDGGVNAPAADVSSHSMRHATWNELQRPLEKRPEEAIRPQDVFPYPKHEDNLRSMLFYLKNYYALEPEESLRGIETMTPEDVLGLVQCFYVDAYRVVRHARDAAGVGRAGFTDKDPPMECVMGSASDGELTMRAKGETEDKVVVAAMAPPRQLSPPPEIVNQSLASRRPPSQEYRRQRAAMTSGSSGGGGGGGGCAVRTPLGRSYTPQSHARLEHPTPDGANTSFLTDGTLLSVEPPQEPSSGIIKRPLKELMPILRSGSTLCKHVENGRPHTRFFRVEDYLGEYHGEEALMPHLVWYPTATDRKPSEALKLLSLLGVYLLSSDAGGAFRKLFRRSRGVVLDHSRRPVADGMCVVFRFEKRDVAVSFLTEGDRQLWVGGMMGVVEKNKQMVSRLHQ
ncbi:hypothetical protein MOQ_008289 [Trypanosoma cruzi marinkellei]|uniref:PH-like domain-containing protein n=1 Tax=Trypanosoma cruzi marinkellei TaxID=85056 RepID=K2NG66_TRYCR|nr:hypothetical protein MOQ_008289 [Trypanosoma cruzi marinkellei]